ncbi:hypothetical protein [Clostridium taeniosporum]|uniref:GAF domain-containing protein n=1 Tax=Clostridium taeniosporum TaxID=394958 RepID=A0A1D7XMW0_9CLOT|nr:hypothetical protein [Clostridium taeniosporum]AOR24607.1 hypothetical protein BGI42_13035 [Clostridium taeniosporum]
MGTRELLDNLFKELKDVIYYEDVGIHKIIDDSYIKPYYKQLTDISFEKWSKYHASKMLKIVDDMYLSEMMNTKKSLFIDKLSVDKNKPSCLRDFGIVSTCLIPFFLNDEIVFFITMPIFKQEHKYSEEEKLKAIDIVKKYNNILCIEEMFKNEII